MTAFPTYAASGPAFRKMHGLGNDFVVLDARVGGEVPPIGPGFARSLADRRLGIGCDQVVVLHPAAPGSGADAGVAFWNADGTEAGACGNATRCVARLLMAEGIAAPVIASRAGLLHARPAGDERITVDMGPARLDWREIPLDGPADTLSLPIEGAPVAVSMGNPHCVYLVDDAEAVDLAAVGPAAETHALFPERTNVEFVSPAGPGRLRLRVWERGAGITRACGSGACAALVAAARRGLSGRVATILLDGGALDIRWREADGHVEMTGPVAEVFSGRIAPDLLAAADAGTATEVA